jgi:hypothetical protein
VEGKEGGGGQFAAILDLVPPAMSVTTRTLRGASSRRIVSERDVMAALDALYWAVSTGESMCCTSSTLTYFERVREGALLWKQR